MRHFKGMGVFACLLAAFGLAACGGGSYGTNGGGGGGTQSASVFTIGTDAPLPSVVSCLVTVSGITLSNGSTDVSVLSSPQVVDFAQLSGLHQLIDLQSVPTGTYTSATVTLSAAQIGYIDTTQNPPAISTITGTLSPASATVTFAKPFVLQSADLVGLRMEFDLRKSIQVDSSGNVTGVINPTFEMALRDAADAEVSIDDFDAGVTSVISPTMFTVQGPAGRTWTVQTAPTTAMDDPTIPENTFTTNTIVSISGTLDRVSRSEEHTSELQSPVHLVCRLLLEKKKNRTSGSWRLPRSACSRIWSCASSLRRWPTCTRRPASYTPPYTSRHRRFCSSGLCASSTP